jgi:hypothetical protein
VPVADAAALPSRYLFELDDADADVLGTLLEDNLAASAAVR